MTNCQLAFALAALMSILDGCANPPIIPVTADTYLLSKEDHAGIFGSLSKLKAEVITEANSFASSKGKVAIPISFREKPVGNSPGDWAMVEYQFKLVDPNSAEAAITSLEAGRKSVPVRPDISIQSNESISADVNVTSTAHESSGQAKDLYAELLKLEDLRKRGILTGAEFEEQKAKLLRAE